MNNKLNDIEYDEVKILIIEELTKFALIKLILVCFRLASDKKFVSAKL